MNAGGILDLTRALSDEKKIGEILVNKGVLTPQQIETILKERLSSEERFGEIALRLDLVSERDLAEALAEQTGLKYIDLRTTPVDLDVALSVPPRDAERYNVLALFEEEGKIVAAVIDPFDAAAKSCVTKCFSSPVEFRVAEPSLLFFTRQKIYPELSYERQIDELLEELVEIMEKEGVNTQIPFVGKLVHFLVYKAMADHATDLHLTSDERAFRIFFRIRGQMYHFRTLPAKAYSPVSAYIKVMANIPTGDPLHIFDGAMTIKVGIRNVSIRVSKVPTMPPLKGESLVLRIIDRNRVRLSLDTLGFFLEDYERLKELTASPYGFILVTGPTGSGKTTTLYSFLMEKDPFHNTVLTIEDPVEVVVPGVRQLQVNQNAGITFASAIRAFLRQDPDVILVGEIRDTETAQTAVDAALTGHLVFSTLHTNTALESISRLRELQVEPTVIAQSLLGVLNQRLIRVVCPKCFRWQPLPEKAKKYFKKEEIPPPEKERVPAPGNRNCPLCQGTGFSSMTIAYEVLVNTPGVKTLIEKKAPLSEIEAQARKDGFRSLSHIALLKVKHGITSFEEVRRRVLRFL